MRVLFLDVDGVLNGHEKHCGSDYTIIRTDCVNRLNYVIKQTGCVLVISSAWRYMMIQRGNDDPDLSMRGFEYMLRTHGIVGSSVVGFTCPDELIDERGKQILEWLKDHNGCRPKIQSWAVVDDLPIAGQLGKFRKRFVQTNGRVGLMQADTVKLIKLLT